MADPILSKLESSRKELLDLGLRNTLLNYHLPASRGIHIVEEDPAAIYDLLVRQGKSLSFRARAENGPPPTPAELKEAQADTRLQTSEPESLLQKRLLNTYYAAHTSIEEQGVNILYLALGLLRWYESDSSSEERLAPLVLVPVLLERSSVRERFRIRQSPEDTGKNLSLQEKLRVEFGIALPDFPEAEELSIPAYFDATEAAIAGHPRWAVLRDRIELGFFSFGKFMIFHDLDSDNWPAGKLPQEHELLQSLLHSGFQETPFTIGEDAFIDTQTRADELFQVVDADSSQLLAMLAVHEGRNLVVQGPPGTGKSQTITNIIANAIGQGKKVLFVAEKMAALEVVKRRLDAIGLGDACLELHSHKANKKELHQELRRVADLRRPVLDKLREDVALLGKDRDELNAYCHAVNAPIGASGLTPHQVYGYLLQLEKIADGTPLPRIALPQIDDWSAAKMQQAEAMAGRIEARLKDIGLPSALAFWGTGLHALLPREEEAIAAQLQQGIHAVVQVQEAAVTVAAQFGLTIPANREGVMKLALVADLAAQRPNLEGVEIHDKAWMLRRQDIEELVQSGRELAALKTKYASVLLPEAWQADMLPIRQHLMAHGTKWYRFLIGDYKRAVRSLQAVATNTLPEDNDERLQYVNDLLRARHLQTIVDGYAKLAGDIFTGPTARSEEDWTRRSAAADYLARIHQQITEGHCPAGLLDYLAKHLPPADAAAAAHDLLQERLRAQGREFQQLVQQLQFDEQLRDGRTLLHLDHEAQQQLLNQWRSELPSIHQSIAWNNLAALAKEEGLDCLAQAAVRWPEAAQLLKTALQKTWYEYLAGRALDEQPALRRFERQTHEEVIRQFRRLDELNLRYNRARVAWQHAEGLPGWEAGGQVGILRTEFNKKARHLPIRKVLLDAGLAVQAIKPVFMMSPLSIANFLAPGGLDFDLVIFDEASQVRPVEALGAILRGRQLVVVGDTKQLPPSSFFDTLNEDQYDEESETADLQSILALCDAKGAPQRMLRWHYRSRHESLISLSNQEFYERRLVIFPSPGSKTQLGLLFHHLPNTVYDRGKTRTNPLEADRVAMAVMEHAKLHPGLSLGVVAFSAAQRQAIEDAVEARRKADPGCESFFKSQPDEPFFIKNLENVQGDERDVIFISVGYGRDEAGYVSMVFGPLNQEGGERRLNVLITRAKLRCEVFTNMTSDDIDLARTKKFGVRAFKHFLHFAQHGQLDLPGVEEGLADSPFEEHVYDELTKLGYQVRRQVGSKGFFLDLAIVDEQNPGRYVLGIECDGAAYHSARSARDRDRLRQQVLEAMGWRIHRIWSTDWFRNPDREVKRVVEAIQKAKQIFYKDDEAEEAQVVETAIVREAGQAPADWPLYESAELPAEVGAKELHLHAIGKLAGWVEDVVRQESPVHFDEVARRMAEAAGVSRVGNRIREQLRLAARFAAGGKKIRMVDEFLWDAAMEKAIPRDRSALPPGARKVRLIAPEELEQALVRVVREAIAIQPEAAIALLSRLFGFSRLTEELRSELMEVVTRAVASGAVVPEGELLRVPG